MQHRSTRVTKLLTDLTTEEKADIVTGAEMWTTRTVERLGVPAMTVTDGPNGARGAGLMGTGTATACIPAGSVLGATWDPALLEALGGLLGDESLAKGANVLLGPTINLHRSPLGGRNFECYSEDPLLTGHLAAAFIQGVQSRGVATTAKHFVANDSEFERNTIDSQVDERTLREVYLLPFEIAVKAGDAWGLMSAYNRLNGVFCSEHSWLLGTVLREQWGFDGFVVSDWFAARSTADSIKAGLSLEMPGEGNFYGREKIAAAIDAGDMTLSDLDAIVADMLVLAERTGAFDGRGGEDEKPLDRPEDRLLTRRAAAAGAVLLRNDGVLPLDVGAIKTLAVIGPNAFTAKIMGGGSAGVRAYRMETPLEVITERLGDSLEIRSALGCNIDRTTPPVTGPMLDGTLALEFFNSHDFSGEVVARDTKSAADFLYFGTPAPGVETEAFSVRATGTIVPTQSGPHRVVLEESGRTRVLIDGQVALDATGEYEQGDAFFSFGSVEIAETIELTAGTASEFVVEFSNIGAVFLAGVKVGVVPIEEPDYLGEALALARDCDVVVVVVGTNDDWETEGRDRDQFALPGDQPELIRQVSAANDKTVVVVNAGGPHAMDWVDDPAAVLNIGFGGQDMSQALVDLLLGDAEPGGRMPTTIPARYEHHPAYPNYPGENSVVRYGEGVHIGYRWFAARHIDPAVPFGAGLSYASFTWGAPRLSVESAPTDVDAAIIVEVDVTNTGDRDGSDVVQVYVGPPPSVVQRPPLELKGFAKVHVAAGQSATARIELDRRAFAYFDAGDQVFEALASLSPVPAKAAENRHTEAGWYVEPGTYAINVAHNAAEIEATVNLELTGEPNRTDA